MLINLTFCKFNDKTIKLYLTKKYKLNFLCALDKNIHLQVKN